jgi:hypothetical protein
MGFPYLSKPTATYIMDIPFRPPLSKVGRPFSIHVSSSHMRIFQAAEADDRSKFYRF